MDAAATTCPETTSTHAKSYGWKLLWFGVHLGVVYLLVNWVTPWSAGWVQGSLLPVLGPPKSISGFQFLFSHLLAFSFVPAFVVALANLRSKQNVVAYVWLVPTLVLFYKLVSFPTASVFQSFQSHASSAFHYYLGGEFSIPEYHSWQEFWSITVANADVERGMEQMHFTAPFYGGVGYSIAGWIGARFDLRRKITTKVAEWEDAKFGSQQADKLT